MYIAVTKNLHTTSFLLFRTNVNGYAYPLVIKVS